MAYVRTNWVDNVTVVNDSNLNKIENGIGQLDLGKSDTNHNHDDKYAALVHAHSNYALITDVYEKGDVDAQLSVIRSDITSLEDWEAAHNIEFSLLSSEVSILNGANTTNVNTIRNVQRNMGNLADLTTTDKLTIVAAINEIEQEGVTFDEVYPVGTVYNGTEAAVPFTQGTWTALMLPAGFPYNAWERVS